MSVELFNENASKIIFLDMDGPICNLLTHTTRGVIGGSWKVCDSNAIGLLNRLYLTDPENTAIVMNSTWNSSQKKVFNALIENGGYIGKFHSDWRTKKPHLEPEIAVQQWLDNHEALTSWIVIDDYPNYEADVPLILVDATNGINYQNMEDSFRLLHNTTLLDASHVWQPRPKYN